ncbi:putative pantophysin [Listeria ivanovii FSL F6-596]|nr:putative pantophysin [Listeria ivanovii FSL F6-596]
MNVFCYLTTFSPFNTFQFNMLCKKRQYYSSKEQFFPSLGILLFLSK